MPLSLPILLTKHKSQVNGTSSIGWLEVVQVCSTSVMKYGYCTSGFYIPVLDRWKSAKPSVTRISNLLLANQRKQSAYRSAWLLGILKLEDMLTLLNSYASTLNTTILNHRRRKVMACGIQSERKRRVKKWMMTRPAVLVRWKMTRRLP